jgi:hypothetical protein
MSINKLRVENKNLEGIMKSLKKQDVQIVAQICNLCYLLVKMDFYF